MAFILHCSFTTLIKAKNNVKHSILRAQYSTRLHVFKIGKKLLHTKIHIQRHQYLSLQIKVVITMK